MKRVIMLLALFFVAGALTLSAGFFPFKAHEKIMENGFKIIAVPLPNPGIVAYYSVVRTGSRDEFETGHTGFAHFFEHMMFKGTKNFPSDVYDGMMTLMGADTNAFTGDDLTTYHLTFAKDDLEKVMELESDRFQNLDYDEEVFKTESGAVYGEYLKSKANPFFILFENMYDTAFDKHTYKHTTIGFEADVKAMPTMYEFSKSFFNRYYRPENVVLLICGDIDPENVFKLAEKYYGKWQKGYVPPAISEEPGQTAPRAKIIQYPGKILPLLAVAYKGLQFDPQSKEYVASVMLGDIMFGDTSEIYAKLVLNEQKVQMLGANFGLNRDPNLNAIMAMVKKIEDVEYIKAEIDRTLKKYQAELMDAKRLEDLKSNLKYSFLMRLSSTADVAGSLPEIIAISGGIDALDRYYTTLQTITPEDIRQAAIKYFTDHRKTEILVRGE